MEHGGISLALAGSESCIVLTVSGVLDGGNAGSLSAPLGSAEPVHVLDLAKLDLDGSEAVLEAVDAIRRLLASSGRLTVCNSPQILAHALYRIGLLENGTLELTDTRQEEPYG